MKRYDFCTDAQKMLDSEGYEKLRAAVGEVIFETPDPRDIPSRIRWLGTKFAEQHTLNEIARMAYDMQYEMPIGDDV